MTRARYAPISDPDITEYNGLRWSAGAAAGALPEPASSRAAHPVPPCPLRTILTSNDPPENGKTGFLKFLGLGWGNVAATSTWPGCGARRPAPGPGRAGEAGAPDEVLAGVCGARSVQPPGLSLSRSRTHATSMSL